MARLSCEKSVSQMIAKGVSEIWINWINISAAEAKSGAADRITVMLFEAGYRPDGALVIEELREDYMNCRRVEGRFVRLPQETWKLQ